MGVARVGDAQHKTTGGLRIDLQFKSSCRDTANVLYLLHTSSVFYRSSRSEVTEVWWLRTVGPTFSKLLKLDLNISQVQNRRIIQYALH